MVSSHTYQTSCTYCLTGKRLPDRSAGLSPEPKRARVAPTSIATQPDTPKAANDQTENATARPGPAAGPPPAVQRYFAQKKREMDDLRKAGKVQEFETLSRQVVAQMQMFKMKWQLQQSQKTPAGDADPQPPAPGECPR